ncbi:hypothetical protein MRX96_026993 [Rhipicephalus microplus]
MSWTTRKIQGVPLTAGGSRLRKRAATFSEFEAQAVAKKDASVILCCSDMDGLKDKCVPPSFSSELNGTVKNLLVDLNLEDGHSASTPAENAGNFVCDMSEVFDKGVGGVVQRRIHGRLFVDLCGDAERSSGNVRTVQVEPFGMRL